MPAALPLHEMTIIYHQLFNLDRSPTWIAEEYGVGVRVVRKQRQCWQLFGTPRPPKGRKQGRQRICSLAQEDALIEHINEDPSIYLDKMAWFLFNCFGVKPGVTTVFDILARRGWRRKKASKVATQRNETLRAL
jgi:transposase